LGLHLDDSAESKNGAGGDFKERYEGTFHTLHYALGLISVIPATNAGATHFL
jgi:hypothetical protein